MRVFSVRRSAGALTFLIAGLRPLRTSWLMVGNENLAMQLNDWIAPSDGAHGDPDSDATTGSSRAARDAGTHEGVPHAGHRTRSIRNQPLVSVKRARLQGCCQRSRAAGDSLVACPERERLTVLYDADCGVCPLTARMLHALDCGRSLHLSPLQRFVSRAADDPGAAALAERLHVRDADGRWVPEEMRSFGSWRPSRSSSRSPRSVGFPVPAAPSMRSTARSRRTATGSADG